jgi:hypothetical protein
MCECCEERKEYLHKSKIKLSHNCHVGAKGERRYRSYSFLTLALDVGAWSASHPGRALPRERTSVPDVFMDVAILDRVRNVSLWIEVCLYIHDSCSKGLLKNHGK